MAAIARGLSGGFDLELDGGADDETQIAQGSPSHLNQNRQRVKASGVSNLAPDAISGVSSGALLGAESVGERRDNILLNSGLSRVGDEEMKTEGTMKSMKDVIFAVKQNMATPRRKRTETLTAVSPDNQAINVDPHLSLKSTRYYNTAHGVEKKPSFALRVLVQERFSEIIAHEIAGFQSHVDIKNNTLSVTIDSLKHSADKWLIPRRARKSFRAVAFEVLYFVGERDLIVRGAVAVFDLRPYEVQGLFGPLLAAFGDADTMEAWLMRTQVMADNELTEEANAESRQQKFEQVEENRSGKITQNMTATPNAKRNVIGNAVTNLS